MKAAPDAQEDEFVLHGLYQLLPVGAAFLSPERKVFAANQKMRSYFPALSGRGSDGSLICEAVRCPEFQGGTGRRECAGSCEDCILSRGIKTIICDNKPMRETKWRHVSRRGNHQFVRWFYVSGNPVSFCGGHYAALFFNDITGLVLKEEILRRKLRLDQQTKVLNKVSLLRSLDEMLRTKQAGPVTICMVDFDNFKNINDRYGHLMGDRVLDTFCGIARQNIRAGDILGRFGGEEFLFIFQSDQEQAASILQRIQSDLRQSFAAVFSFPVTFSAGVASCGRKRRAWEDLVKEADRLLYRAKAEGKNRIVRGIKENRPDRPERLAFSSGDR